GDELLAAEHALQLLAPLLVAELRDRRVRRVAGNLLDAEGAVGERRDLRQVRDRHDLGALGQAAQRLADRVRGLAADTGVDLVEDHRLAAADRCDREGDPRELAAGGRLRDPREWHARARPEPAPGTAHSRAR